MARAKSPRNGNSRSKSSAAAAPATTLAELNSNSYPAEVEAEIRDRAYQLYEERGCIPGHEHEDWLVAEREVLARYQGV
jgi:hypothetical protein